MAKPKNWSVQEAKNRFSEVVQAAQMILLDTDVLSALRRSVGLKVLKNKLGEYVRLAARGETVLITDRDTVVAEIVPPRPGRSTMLADAWLAEAVRNGWIAPPAFAADMALPGKPIMPFCELMREIEADREQR